MTARLSPLLRVLLAAVFVLGLLDSSEAKAQPGGQGYPPQQPAPYYGGGYARAPAPNLHLLTQEERQILWQGEITPGQVIGGGLLSAWLGFGVGHAVQGRYSDVGWKFTVGEAAAIGAVFIGVARLSGSGYREDNGGETLLITGALSLGILRIWELVDVLSGPSDHNRRYRAARWKAYGSQPAPPRYGLFITPGGARGGGTAGLTMRF